MVDVRPGIRIPGYVMTPQLGLSAKTARITARISYRYRHYLIYPVPALMPSSKGDSARHLRWAIWAA